MVLGIDHKKRSSYSKEETAALVDMTARTMAKLYHYLASEMVAEYGEEAKAVIKRAIGKFGEDRGEGIRRKVLEQGLPLTLANMHANYDLPLPVAWIAERMINEPCHVEKKVNYCPFAAEWLERGDPELAAIYCYQDQALVETYNPDVEFEQYTNVLLGHCDCHTQVRIPNLAAQLERNAKGRD